MSRFTIVLILLGVFVFFLSSLRIDIFTWKDSNRLERLVVTTKQEDCRTDYPAFPEELKKDERLEHKEGLGGLGAFGVNKIKDCFPPQKEGEGADRSQQASIPSRPHSVGKPSESQEDLNAPSVPETVEVKENESVGTAAAVSDPRSSFVPNAPLELIPRVFEDPEMVLMGSFCVDPLKPKDLEHPQMLDDFLTVVAQFDLLAIQGIYTQNSQMLKEIASEVSRRSGRNYTYAAIIPTTNVSVNRPVPVFVYDSNVLELDPSTLQFVGQPNQPFAFPPLAAKFRVKKAPAESAFTFIAVNMQTFPGYELQELQYVPNMMTRLKDSVSKGNFDREDDVILFGYFGTEPKATVVGDSRFNQTITWANPDYPTNTFGKFSYVAENILFQTVPLAEYSNNSGVWDLRKQFRRTRKIPFDHHPVWACFGIREGAAAQNP